MTGATLDWIEWQQRFEQIDDPPQLRANIEAAALSLRRLLGNTARSGWWDRLGVLVHRRPMRYPGNLVTAQTPIRINLNRSDGAARQRFTVAHELGHVFLYLRRHNSAAEKHEALCDLFAQQLLIPLHAVSNTLTYHGGLSGPREFLELTNHFGVGLSTALIAYANAWTDPHTCLLLLERQPDFRVRAIDGSGARVRQVAGQRSLTSMGFDNLSIVLDQRCTPWGKGRDLVDFRYLAGPHEITRSGRLRGSCEWEYLDVRGDRHLVMLRFHAATIEPSRKQPSTANTANRSGLTKNLDPERQPSH